jgi:putative ABC transport system permease protein
MIEHYIKTSFRNFRRYKGYTLINISGLAIGIATCLIIFTYLSFELSYDKFNKDYDDVYRVFVKGRFSQDFFDAAVSMPALEPQLKMDFPEVKAATRVDKYMKDALIAHEDKKFYEEGLYFVDSAFFEVFSFDMISGNPQTALQEINSVVLTETLAKKYFADEDPFGKMLRLNDQVNLKVTGVIRDIPANSHMKFTMLGSNSTVDGRLNRDSYTDNWGSLYLYTYIRLYPGTDANAFGEKIKPVIRNAFGDAAEQYNIEMIPYLQPVTDIHLHSNKMAELEPTSDISYIYIFSAVAIFILVIACINFMNLSTARSMQRSREVGMRKVSGATKNQLVRQFLVESLIISFICMIIAYLIVEIAIPVFSNLTGIDLDPFFHRPMTFIVLLLLGIFAGLFAGSYPAFVLSSFQPIRAIKGELYRGMKKSLLRNLLVVLQFTISITLLISTWLIYKQMNYVSHKNLGFDKENMVIIPLKSDRVKERGNMLKAEFEKLGTVKMISLTSSVPGEGLSGQGYSPEGVDNKSPWILYKVVADYNFTDVFGMKIKEGRALSKDFGMDSNAVVINETLVKKLGWTDPIGKKIYDFGHGDSVANYFTVVGVVEDYHFTSLHDAIEPSIILLNKGNPDFLAIRLNPGDPGEGIKQLQQKWEEVESAFPFEYFFLKDDYEDQYKSENKMADMFITFTILAMFIACLGLFGLALFSIGQRTKEIGIRKILGASVSGIIYRLSREFSKWILIAAVIAWPLSYFLVTTWLESFAYRIEVLNYAWIFIASALVALVIAQITISYHAYRAAVRNPVDAVKWE